MINPVARQTIRQQKEAFRKIMLSQTFRIIVVLSLLLLLILDVFQTSVVSASGSDITSLQRDVRELKYENEKLEYKIAQYRSMSSIQERVDKLSFESVSEVDYFMLPGSAVAIK